MYRVNYFDWNFTQLYGVCSQIISSLINYIILFIPVQERLEQFATQKKECYFNFVDFGAKCIIHMFVFGSGQSECDLIVVRLNALKFSTWLLVMDEITGMSKRREKVSYLKSKCYLLLIIFLFLCAICCILGGR